MVGEEGRLKVIRFIASCGRLLYKQVFNVKCTLLIVPSAEATQRYPTYSTVRKLKHSLRMTDSTMDCMPLIAAVVRYWICH